MAPQASYPANVTSDLQHMLFMVTLDGKLHLAPIGPNPQNVLDIATGQRVSHIFHILVLIPVQVLVSGPLNSVNPLI